MKELDMATEKTAAAQPAYRPSLIKRILRIQELGVLVIVALFFVSQSATSASAPK